MDYFTLIVASLFIFAYLLGSANFAILLCRLYGYDDPRESGSKNPGATNVLRVSNKYLAFAVFFCDGLKGFLPVILAKVALNDELIIAFVGLFAFLGHLYPVFFNFEGGKGVATYIGVLAGLFYPVALIFCILWLLVAVTTKYSSLGAISAVSASPVFLIWFFKFDYLYAIALMVVLLLYKHKDNIQRLKDGTETKINI